MEVNSVSPSPAQQAIQAQISVEVLKKSLDVQLAQAQQLVNMTTAQTNGLGSNLDRTI